MITDEFEITPRIAEAMQRLANGYDDCYENGLMLVDVAQLQYLRWITTVQYSAKITARLTPLGHTALQDYRK